MTSYFPRATAIEGYSFLLIDKSTGDPVTSGTVTVRISKDGGAQVAATNAPVHNGNGEWLIDITAPERDAKITTIIATHIDAVTYHQSIYSDDQQGPGSLACVIQLGSIAALADIWITTVADEDNVIASGQVDHDGNITFYLDSGSYKVFRQKTLVDFDPNPATINVTNAATFNLAAYTSVAESTISLETLATLTQATYYFSTILHTENWDNASEGDKQKALMMATRAINLLAFQGDPTEAAVALGNQFPRGEDTEIPDEIIWACCEEALALLGRDTAEEKRDELRIKSESFSGASVSYQDYQPEHTQSGILSTKAWDFLTPYLRDNRNMRLYRV